MASTLQTVRIVDLPGIPRNLAARIRAGQQEAAKVWMACRKPASLEAGVSHQFLVFLRY